MAKILTYPDHTLLQISGFVRDFKDPKINEIVEEIKKTIEENNLQALAAIQIGVPLRIIVLKKKDGNYEVMINPTIYGKEGQYFASTESDESLPNIEVTVNRYPVIKIMYEDLQGNQKFYIAKDDEAVLLQRKIDMVFGGYLFDKLSKKEQKKFFKEYGSYGDTCPTYFIKDRILTALRLFLVGHFFLLLLAIFVNFARFVLTYNTPLFLLEFAWLIFYAIYARYETKKYKNCTSCQNANIIGTSALYMAIIAALYGGSWLIKSF
ncbi:MULTISPECIES: peptide deformylase [unclassified Nitratiruptor]|uniref:peptide deformylase n=1 Tax=unclassified Nitratiruptor TaxID=2624044 RepID=UPI0019159811|nr:MULTISPECIES: peptide deformylase [unclassified Nitratiruptor]BCD59658.1 peptide deformylase [Nitratiruptor sp. YY08-10]BCD63582.1 peptide deformylase [Nitratiruptor sp. YY08-14]